MNTPRRTGRKMRTLARRQTTSAGSTGAEDFTPHQKRVRSYLVFVIEVSVGLVITWAVLALIYYCTDPQVMTFREWFR